MVVLFLKTTRLGELLYERYSSGCLPAPEAHRLIEQRRAREFYPLCKHNTRLQVRRYRCRLVRLMNVS